MDGLNDVSKQLEEIENIKEEQGWNSDTMLDLYKDFVNNKDLTGEFAQFLREIQKEENNQATELDIEEG